MVGQLGWFTGSYKSHTSALSSAHSEPPPSLNTLSPQTSKVGICPIATPSPTSQPAEPRWLWGQRLWWQPLGAL